MTQGFLPIDQCRRTAAQMLMCFCVGYGPACLAADPGSAPAPAGESVPEQGSQKLIIDALGEYQQLNELIYLGAIYLPISASGFDDSGAMRMEMRIAAEEISGRRFTRLWLDSISLNASREQRERLIEQIRAFGDIYQQSFTTGDHIAFEYQPNARQTVFTLDDVRLGVIPGEEFFRILLSVWVGDNPKSSELKTALHESAAHGIDVAASDAFYALDYDDSRKQDLERAIAAEKREAREERLAEEARLQELKRQEEQALAQARAEAEQQRLAEEERLRQERLEAERLRKEQEALAQARHEEQQQAMRHDYARELTQWIGKYVVYPDSALRRGIEGRVEIEVTSDRAGNVIGSEIVGSSGMQVLDRAADDIVMSAQPMPAIPGDLDGDNFTFVMPIAFILED